MVDTQLWKLHDTSVFSIKVPTLSVVASSLPRYFHPLSCKVWRATEPTVPYGQQAKNSIAICSSNRSHYGIVFTTPTQQPSPDDLLQHFIFFCPWSPPPPPVPFHPPLGLASYRTYGTTWTGTKFPARVFAASYWRQRIASTSPFRHPLAPAPRGQLPPTLTCRILAIVLLWEACLCRVPGCNAC